MSLHKYEIDVAVLLVFFARPDTFRQVFAQVKKARPSKLFFISRWTSCWTVG